MIKDQSTTIGYHCPFCGMAILNPITMFAMSGNLIKLKCVCGGSELAVHITKDKKFRITVPCIVCPNSHTFTVSSNIFFERDLFAFACTFTSIDICFIGKYSKVHMALKKNEEELLKAFAEYENYYSPDNSSDNKESPGFTTSFQEDGNHSHGKNDAGGGIDIFNPFANFGNLENSGNFVDLDEDEFWDLWETGGDTDDMDNIDDIDDMPDIYFPGNIYGDYAQKEQVKKNSGGFELYKPGDSVSSKTKNKKSGSSGASDKNGKDGKNKKNGDKSFKFVEIDEREFSKIKIKTYPIILQILDVVSGLYRENKIFCQCGNFNGKIALLENFVRVGCKNCGSKRDIKSTAIADIEYIVELGELYLDFD